MLCEKSFATPANTSRAKLSKKDWNWNVCRKDYSDDRRFDLGHRHG